MVVDDEFDKIGPKQALGYYQKLADSFPDSKYHYFILLMKAELEVELGEKQHAISSLNEILYADSTKISVCEAETKRRNLKWNASTALAEIYMADNNFTGAISALDIGKNYPSWFDCGNAAEEQIIHRNIIYAKCYIALNKFYAAKKILIPNILNNPFANNKEIVHLAYSTLLKEHGREFIKLQYEKAFNNVYSEKTDVEYEHQYYIIFLDTRIDMFSFYPLADKDMMISKYKKGDFYNLLYKQ